MDDLLAAFLGSLLPTSVALLAYFKVKKLHVEVNGKMEKLLKLTGVEAFSRGQLKGAKDERTHRNEDD